jgi:hypothetical protein
MINYKKTVLLTGAGFSKNFGGYLAKEMWSKIFNHPDIKKFPLIEKKLKSNFDFESVYADVLEDVSISADDKGNFQRIIIEAYVSMDDMLGRYVSNSDDPYQIHFGGVSQFLGLFAGVGDEVGIHFTLNQDLFLERQNGIVPLGLRSLQYQHYTDAIVSHCIDSRISVSLPDNNFIENFKKDHLNSAGDLFYIKLHGSLGWYSTTGAKKMVLGNNKLASITQEPLLKWYFNIFKETLSRDGVKLFVLGYSFNDSHINKIIVRAIKDHGLKLYIISPTDPEIFKNRLIGKPIPSEEVREIDKTGLYIWQAVSNYFPYVLKEVFPLNQNTTDKRDDLFAAVKS